MRGQQDDGLTCLDATVHELGVFDRDAPLDRLRTRAESPERFDQRIGEIAIGAPDDDRALVVVLVWKCIGNITLAVVAPPAHQMKRNEVHQGAPRIQQAERYAGQESKEELHGRTQWQRNDGWRLYQFVSADQNAVSQRSPPTRAAASIRAR